MQLLTHLMMNGGCRIPAKLSSKEKINEQMELEDITVDLETGKIWGTTVRVKADALLTEVLDCVENYYVCYGCGKVYWNGHHLPRYMSSISGVIGKASEK